MINRTLVCVMTKNGKPRKVERDRADEIVNSGGKFISKTRYKAAMAGVKVPESIYKKGDRAVKDFVAKQTGKSKKD